MERITPHIAPCALLSVIGLFAAFAVPLRTVHAAQHEWLLLERGALRNTSVIALAAESGLAATSTATTSVPEVISAEAPNASALLSTTSASVTAAYAAVEKQEANPARDIFLALTALLFGGSGAAMLFGAPAWARRRLPPSLSGIIKRD